MGTILNQLSSAKVAARRRNQSNRTIQDDQSLCIDRGRKIMIEFSDGRREKSKIKVHLNFIVNNLFVM